MKRSISRWTVTLAAAGVLALPVCSFAHTQDPTPQQQQQPQPQPAPERPQQSPASPQATQPPTASTPSANQATNPQEQLRQAQSAANAIETTSVSAKNRAAVEDLKRHLSNLEKLGSSGASTDASPSGANAKMSWGSEVAAIDKIIGDMVGGESSTPTTPEPTTPTPTGTSGTTAKSTIDDATRAKLMAVRTHITAYAAGMAGTSTPKTEASAASDTAAAAASPTSSSTPSAQPPAGAPSQPGAAPAPSQAPQSTPPQNPAPPQNPPTTPPDPNAPTQQPPTTAQPPAAGAQSQIDTDAAHRHLVAARDSLSQLTQLPAATQLNGEARTQVAQLITNFNELIGNPPDWQVSYQKVAANLNTLLGPDNSDTEATAGAPTTNTGATAAPGAPAAAAPGAVGTSGTASAEIDPTIRAKLVEFRKSLNEFQKAAGGGK